MEGWKETEIGLIPEDWEQSILSEYAEKPQYGFTDSSSNSGNAKFLRITDITDTGVDWNNVPYCTCPDIEKYKLENSDIVFARIGATTGKSYIIKNPPKAVFASYLIRVRTKSKLLSEYLIFFFNSEYYWKQINSQKGNNLKGGVNGSILSNLRIIVPPLPEQRKISHILCTLQKAIGQQNKLIKTTTKLKKALMKKLFAEGLYGEKQKETKIGLVPESWEQIKIGELGRCVTGTTPRTKIEEYWKNPEYDFIAPADIGATKYIYKSEKQISKLGLGVSRVLPKNSVMCVCIGSSIGKVGLTFKEQSSTNQQINSLICSESYHPVYIYYLLVQLNEYWRNHATFGPVPILNKGQFEQIKIYVTKIETEQKEIADSLEFLDLKIEFYEKKKHTLIDLFKTMLHELMTGQRRVNEIDFEDEKEELLLAAEPEIKYNTGK